MKKYALLIAVMVMALYGWRRSLPPGSESSCAVAILQTGSHPALDLTREAFKKQLMQLQSDLQFIEHNGMGQMAALQAAAQSLCTNPRVKLILAIGTPAVQMIAQLEKQRPIVFAAVTDPLALALPKSSNVCGVSDGIDSLMQLNGIRERMPQLKKMAILYSPAESNSVSTVAGLQQAALELDMELLILGAQTTSEVPALVARATRSCQALFIPADNLMASCLPVITRLASHEGKPVITGYSTGIEQGAAMAFGVDYARCGSAAAHQAHLLLKGESTPSTLGSERLAPSVKVDLNRLEQLNRHQISNLQEK